MKEATKKGIKIENIKKTVTKGIDMMIAMVSIKILENCKTESCTTSLSK
jgi:hypothetical protein